MITELSICWGHHQRHFLIIFNQIKNFRKNTFFTWAVHPSKIRRHHLILLRYATV